MMEIQRILMALAVIFCFCAAADEDISLEFITGLDAVDGNNNTNCKVGYTKLPANLNNGTFEDSSYVFACIKRSDGNFRTPLNDIVVIESANSLSESNCPENYHFVDTNLNSGVATKSHYVYFCYSRGLDTMVTEIDFLQYKRDASDEDLAKDYANGTCRTTNLNEGAGGNSIYLCFSFIVNNITKIELSNVEYDFDKSNVSYVNIETVEAIVIYNPSDIDSSPGTLTGTYSFTSNSNWDVSDSESKTIENGIDLSVTAGIPCLGVTPGGEASYGWTESDEQTHQTTTGLGLTVQVDKSYSISCVAPKKTMIECGGEYKQGKISIPYNATRKITYNDGHYEITNITNHMYNGITDGVLQIYQDIVQQL